MNGKNDNGLTKQVYLRVPVFVFDEMQKHGLLNPGLDAWFTAEIMKRIMGGKMEEKSNDENNKVIPSK